MSQLLHSKLQPTFNLVPHKLSLDQAQSMVDWDEVEAMFQDVVVVGSSKNAQLSFLKVSSIFGGPTSSIQLSSLENPKLHPNLLADLYGENNQVMHRI